MNTYTFTLTNKDDCEWIEGEEGGGVEVISLAAPSLEEAFKRIDYLESIDDDIWDLVRANLACPKVSDIHFPIHMEITEIVGVVSEITQERIAKAMQSYLDKSYKTISEWHADEVKAEKEEQDAIEKLKTSAASKLTDEEKRVLGIYSSP